MKPEDWEKVVELLANVRMLAPDAVFVVEGEEARVLLNMLRQLWVDSHV